MKTLPAFGSAHSLSEAVGSARAALTAARQGGDRDAEAAAAFAIGHLQSCRGEARLAYASFCDAALLWSRIGASLDAQHAELRAATAAWRSGLAGETRRMLHPVGALHASVAAAAALRADASALLMLVAASEHDDAAADRHGNEAIAAAVESGARDTIVRVARSAGQANLRLRRPVEARTAFTQALLLATAAAPAEAPSGEIVAVRLGLARLSGDVRHVVEALRLLPRSLDDDIVWWELPRLLHALGCNPHVLVDPVDPTITHAASRTLIAAAERRDCHDVAERLRRELSRAVPLRSARPA